MALIALALYLVFGALGFGWRSWRQYRRTGSTGFRGVSGRPGSLEWNAGAGFVIAVIIGVAAPALQLFGVVSPIGLLDASWINGVGIVTAVVGIAAMLYAQIDMGDAWRIGVDASETTTLVRRGIFGLVRNPIFSAMIVFAVGITLTAPNPVALAGLLILVVTIELQVRAVEEPYLQRVHGDAYRSYTESVGRFVPRLGRS